MPTVGFSTSRPDVDKSRKLTRNSIVYNAYLAAGDARVIAEKENARLKEANLQIKEQLKITGLDEEQASMVRANAGNIEDKIPKHFQLDWKTLKFIKRLGSGSFGDCYQGTLLGRPVAIKRMRAGLTDNDGFKAYCRETVTMASLDHINVSFLYEPRKVGMPTLTFFFRLYRSSRL